MVFERKLTKSEIKIIEKIIDFVKDKHQRAEGHDYSHVLEVCKNAMEISKKIKQPVNPFVLLCGALLHDIGRVDGSELFHGIDGASRAEEFLESLIEDHTIIDKIERVIVRHSPGSMVSPESIEEKVVFDADTIERLGFMGMIRGIMGKKGTMEFILEDRIAKRLADYDKLFFKESRQLAKAAHKETIAVVKSIRKALKKRLAEIHEIETYRALK